MVKRLIVIMCLGLLAACSSFSGKAPKPPECQGAYRIINVVEQKDASFDGTGKIVRCEDGSRHGHQS